jgi:putative sterol carrier protein
MTGSSLRHAAQKAFRCGFSGVIRIAPEESPCFDVNGLGADCFLEDAAFDRAPDCIWRANSETLNRIFEGGRALESAYLSGRLSISGNLSVMARLILESSK